MGQKSEETITQYSTRLNGQAAICDLTVECPNCNQDVSFRERTIMFQFIRGLSDVKAQERILETAAQVEGGELSLMRVLKIAEADEMGKTSQQLVNQGGQISKLSDYQTKKRVSRQDNKPRDKSESKKCGNCGKSDHTSKLNDRRKNCQAFEKTCSKCQTNGHFASQCRGGPQPRSERDKSKSKINEVKSDQKEDKDKETDPGQVGTLKGSWILINGHVTQQQGDLYEDTDVFSSVRQQDHQTDPYYPSLSAINKNPQVRKIRHHMSDQFGNWQPSNVQPHGRLSLTASLSKSAQDQLQLQPFTNTKDTIVKALADTGAQMCVADWEVAKRMNITPALTVSVADNASLELIGAQFLSLTAQSGHTTQQLVYFAKGVGEFYLSKAALMDLQVISRDFPKVGAHKDIKECGAVNEVQNGLPSASTLVQPQPPEGPGLQVQLSGTPSPLSLPVRHAPSIPLGTTSMGLRSPGSAIMGGTLPHKSLTTLPNGGRPPPVRAEDPLVDQQVMDAPQVLHHQPSTLCLPAGQPVRLRGEGFDPAGDFLLHQQLQHPPQGNLNHFQVAAVQSGSHKSQGNYIPVPYNIQGVPKDINNPQRNNLGQVFPKIQDIGSDWQVENPLLNSRGQGTGGKVINEVMGEFSSVTSTAPTSAKVFDDKGRELASCGCLKRVLPPQGVVTCFVQGPSHSK